MTKVFLCAILSSCISMESGERPELNAQRYAVQNTKKLQPLGFFILGRLFVNAASPETLVHALRMRGNLNFWELRKFSSREGKMKNLKFSRFFAAIIFVAVLGLTGCKPEPEIKEKIVEKVYVARPLSAADKIIGTWVSDWGEKYVISETDYDNYSRYDSNFDYHEDQCFLYYSTNDLYIRKIDDNSGYVYCKFNDAEHVGYKADEGQWYAFFYFDLAANSVKISGAAGEKGGCDTLEEAITEFTVENGYMSTASGKYSALTRE